MDKRTSVIYLATPYTHPDPQVMQQRYERVTRVAAKLISKGEMVISPITHCHPIVSQVELPPTWEYWKDFDRALISLCDRMYILMQPGWTSSVGVKAEMEIALQSGLEVKCILETDL